MEASPHPSFALQMPSSPKGEGKKVKLFSGKYYFIPERKQRAAAVKSVCEASAIDGCGLCSVFSRHVAHYRLARRKWLGVTPVTSLNTLIK